jgi:hypothetical protein
VITGAEHAAARFPVRRHCLVEPKVPEARYTSRTQGITEQPGRIARAVTI